MKTRRPAALAGAAVLGALALTGCNIDKPTPLVTLVSGSTSVHSEAECYKDDGTIDEAKVEGCLNETKVKTISVDEGNSFSVGVDRKIADSGWLLLFDGKPQTQSVIKSTYYSDIRLKYGSPEKGDEPIVVQVVQPDGEKGYRGIWSFKVKKK
ncbi:hypothetical protein [Embleya scabrispora]|uniref:hypothetical protein n=1 Tax=Embleya scabrispora TaxID=159449 RepID=UPI00037B4C4E|nr:hypothetical protein [Embleya scabrispora]MYS85395.1 DUF2771 domain-containing protein [Streptomyces sp. SID5474]